MAKRLISSENYSIPVFLAILLHILVLGGFFIVWSSTPEMPVAKPTMIATLYDVQSKSPAATQSDKKLAGENSQTKAPAATKDQLASQAEEQQKIADQQAEAKRGAEEKVKAEKANKDAEEKAKIERAKAEKANKDAEEKAKIEKAKSDKAKKDAEEKAKIEKAKADKAKKDAEEKAKIEKAKADKAKKNAEEKAKADKAKKDAEQKAKAVEAARKGKEAKEAAALADLLGDKIELETTKGDAQGDKLIGSLDDLVKQLVQDNWTELGNPAPGTRVELTIQMIPDGTITNVTVRHSSGNAAFDASAVTAAKNVGRVPQIQKLDIYTFNQLYRQRTFIFTAKGS